MEDASIRTQIKMNRFGNGVATRSNAETSSHASMSAPRGPDPCRSPGHRRVEVAEPYVSTDVGPEAEGDRPLDRAGGRPAATSYERRTVNLPVDPQIVPFRAVMYACSTMMKIGSARVRYACEVSRSKSPFAAVNV